MKHQLKQTIITGEDFILEDNVKMLDIFEEKYVASIINRKNGQILVMNAVWRVNLSALKCLQQINVFYEDKQTILVRDKYGMFPEFRLSQLGAYTDAYIQLNTAALAA